MINNFYDKQVQLLLKVLPEVAKERNLALHGGTAINLFIKDMPRLSVDSVPRKHQMSQVKLTCLV